MPKVENLKVDQIQENSARLSWSTNDVGKDFAEVEYFTIEYKNASQTIVERVSGISLFIIKNVMINRGRKGLFRAEDFAKNFFVQKSYSSHFLGLVTISYLNHVFYSGLFVTTNL